MAGIAERLRDPLFFFFKSFLQIAVLLIHCHESIGAYCARKSLKTTKYSEAAFERLNFVDDSYLSNLTITLFSLPLEIEGDVVVLADRFAGVGADVEGFVE